MKTFYPRLASSATLALLTTTILSLKAVDSSAQTMTYTSTTSPTTTTSTTSPTTTYTTSPTTAYTTSPTTTNTTSPTTTYTTSPTTTTLTTSPTTTTNTTSPTTTTSTASGTTSTTPMSPSNVALGAPPCNDAANQNNTYRVVWGYDKNTYDGIQAALDILGNQSGALGGPQTSPVNVNGMTYNGTQYQAGCVVALRWDIGDTPQQAWEMHDKYPSLAGSKPSTIWYIRKIYPGDSYGLNYANSQINKQNGDCQSNGQTAYNNLVSQFPNCRNNTIFRTDAARNGDAALPSVTE